MTHRPPPFPDHAVFGNVQDEHHRCCQCCDGYCHLSDTGTEPAVPGMLYAFTVRGVNYVSDRYVAVRADLVAVKLEPTLVGVEDDRYPAAPPSKPPPSVAPLTPVQMHHATAAGFDICGADATHGSIQHVYLGDEHAGWIRAAADSGALHDFTLADLTDLREVADSLPVSENAHPIATAARLLAWERSRRRAPVIDCEDHRPVQHRDARPPWCNKCGLTAGGLKPAGRLDREAQR